MKGFDYRLKFEPSYLRTIPVMSGVSSFGGAFKQSLRFLFFDLIGLITGALIVGYLGLFTAAPWIIVIYPAVISLRGTVGSIFLGHYRIALHLGTMKPGLTNNTSAFYALLSATLCLGLFSCLALWAAAMPFLYTSRFDILPSLMLLVFTAGLSFLVVIPLSTIIVSLGYRRGIYPDILIRPVASTLADLIITACYAIGLYSYFNFGSTAYAAVAVFDVLFFVMVATLFFFNRGSSDFFKTIKESLIALAICSIIANVTGILLLNASPRLEEIKEVINVYPALIDTIGEVSLMVGSILTTRLALRGLSQSSRNFTSMVPEMVGTWSGSLVMFSLFSAIASFFYYHMESISFVRFSVLLMSINILACSAIVLVSIGIALLTYARGPDPDTFAGPIGSSISDCITTASILIALAVFSLAL